MAHLGLNEVRSTDRSRFLVSEQALKPHRVLR